MRRSILKKLVASIVLVAAIIFSGLPTFAQYRSHKDENSRHEHSKYSKRSKGHKNHKNKHYHEKRHKKHKHHDKYRKVRTRHYEGDHYHRDRHVRRHDHRRYERHAHHGHHHKHGVRRYYKRHGHRCYAHPRYGNVVVRFSVRPTIISHCDGDFYYTRGRYYHYYPEIGYVRVDSPESICFEEIPDACERVSYRGGVYFRLGDLSFVKDRHGFRLAGSIDL